MFENSYLNCNVISLARLFTNSPILILKLSSANLYSVLGVENLHSKLKNVLVLGVVKCIFKNILETDSCLLSLSYTLLCVKKMW